MSLIKKASRGGRKNGEGSVFFDRSGRKWEYGNYISPKGPAFWVTLPDDFWPDGTANYTVHFDGVLATTAPAERDGRPVAVSATEPGGAQRPGRPS